MKHLPYDICRCHNAGCPERETCLRWLDRRIETKNGEWTVHSGSLYPSNLPPGSPCPKRIVPESSLSTHSRKEPRNE
jgi:hypothetical protein